MVRGGGMNVEGMVEIYGRVIELPILWSPAELPGD